MTRRNLRFRFLVGAAVVLFAAAACSSSSDDDEGAGPATAAATTEDIGVRTVAQTESGSLAVETTSTRAAYVSGGDVLVSLSGDAAADAVVELNGTDVSDTFAIDGDVRRGLVAGLVDGENTLTATAGDDTVALTVTNHSKNGPLFSGPHLEPWICTTEAAGLGPATDVDCDAPSTTTWSYRAQDGSTKPLATPPSVPTDAATVNVDGRPVPFIVRTETGVIDRGISTLWTLDPDPAAGEWDPAGWNGRLVYRFGGGCGTQYSQGSSFTGGADLDLLGRGYAVATNTLDTFQTACNPTLSAEAALMTREHFVEQYGVPEFTIGDGGSGGAIQQLGIGHNYPGLLDAISASVPFPDATSIAGGVTDCGLLVHYYGTPFGAGLTTEQKEAINGHASTGTCDMWNRLFVGGVNPTDGCPAIGAEVYNPTTNPDGARCTLQDSNVNVLGIDPDTGFARRPLDNVGIQYGLAAVNAGVISVDQFLDLNEHIGAYDIDGNVVAERTEMSEETAAHTYAVGSVIGPGPLLDVPIILRNLYTDDIGDIHTRFHVFSIRDRLQVDGEDDPNLLVWSAQSRDVAASLLGNVAGANEPIVLLDEWLSAGDRPASATNRCVLPDGRVLNGGWELYDEPGPCATAYPVHGDPRLAAGAAQREDVIKCALVPSDPSGYDVAFTDAQQTRLESIFPDGVCDWDAPGVGMRESSGPWQDYSP